jgi:hypothetical protein
MSATEDNPADDVQSTEEEFDAWMSQCPLTDEEAQKAYDAAVPIPLSPERIEEIVNFVVGRTCSDGK